MKKTTLSLNHDPYAILQLLRFDLCFSLYLSLKFNTDTYANVVMITKKKKATPNPIIIIIYFFSVFLYSSFSCVLRKDTFTPRRVKGNLGASWPRDLLRRSPYWLPKNGNKICMFFILHIQEKILMTLLTLSKTRRVKLQYVYPFYTVQVPTALWLYFFFH